MKGVITGVRSHVNHWCLHLPWVSVCPLDFPWINWRSTGRNSVHDSARRAFCLGTDCAEHSSWRVPLRRKKDMKQRKPRLITVLVSGVLSFFFYLFQTF